SSSARAASSPATRSGGWWTRAPTPCSSARGSSAPSTSGRNSGSSRSMVRVKVCGITNLEDARVAVEAGADALGFIFVEGAPRFVTPEQAAPIIRALPPFVTSVGVFWDHPAGHVKAVAEACGLRALQFHGDEPPETLSGYSLPVIKTIKLPPASTIGGMPEYRVTELFGALRYRGIASAILLDTAVRWSEGERREPLEWRGIALSGINSGPGTRMHVVLSG